MEKDISIPDLVKACAVDPVLYTRVFFPSTFRQPSPPFHVEIWKALESHKSRYVAIKVFRGGAKTTLLRAFTSKRIAYGVSRTILYVSESQDLAIRSLRWLKKQVEFNRPWAEAFGLTKGQKWSEDVIEVRHEVLGTTSTVLALGITGQIRGVNVDDYRPDLIVVDDPQCEETAATPEQRRKLSELFFGALAQSLAPPADCPGAKMVLLQTPLHGEDLISTCMRDPAWTTFSFGILDENENSRWPERYPTEEVLKEKYEYIHRGQIALWLREKCCEIVSPETSDFRSEWLRYWDVVPGDIVAFGGIDPVPPPSESELLQSLSNKDYECLAVVGVRPSTGEVFLLDYALNRGHDPTWTIAKFFELTDRWRVVRWRVEGTAYQRTLKWILEQAMAQQRRYVYVEASTDRRKKAHRIVQAFTGLAANGRLYVNRSHGEFIEQFSLFPNCSNFDVLDAAALASTLALDWGGAYPDIGSATSLSSLASEPLPSTWRSAP